MWFDSVLLFFSFLSYEKCLIRSTSLSWWMAGLLLVVPSVVVRSSFLWCQVVSPPGGHDLFAHPSCLSQLSLGGFFLTLFGLPSLFVLFFGVLVSRIFPFFSLFLFLFLVFFLCLSFFSLFQCIWVVGVRMLCLSYPVRWHGIALSTRFTSLNEQHYDVLL